MSCGRSRNAAPSMYSGSWPRLYVTTALARFAGFVSMSVLTCGERMNLSGRNDRAGGSSRTAARAPQPARTATRATAAAKRTPPGYRRLARPILDGIGGLRDDDVVRELVVPGLLLLVPEHPEVAEEAGDRRDVAADPADERPSVADRAAGPEVDDPDPHRLLPHRLAGGAALEVGQVGDREQDLDHVAERGADRVEDPADDADQDAVDERGDEAAPEARARAGRPGACRWLIRRLLIRGVGHCLSLGVRGTRTGAARRASSPRARSGSPLSAARAAPGAARAGRRRRGRAARRAGSPRARRRGAGGRSPRPRSRGRRADTGGPSACAAGSAGSGVREAPGASARRRASLLRRAGARRGRAPQPALARSDPNRRGSRREAGRDWRNVVRCTECAARSRQ